MTLPSSLKFGPYHAAAKPRAPLLEIRDLKVHFDLGGGTVFDRIMGGPRARQIVKAVDGDTHLAYVAERHWMVGSHCAS